MTGERQMAGWAVRVLQTIEMSTSVLGELVEDVGDRSIDADETQRTQWSEMLAWLRGKLDEDAADIRTALQAHMGPPPNSGRAP